MRRDICPAIPIAIGRYTGTPRGPQGLALAASSSYFRKVGRLTRGQTDSHPGLHSALAGRPQSRRKHRHRSPPRPAVQRITRRLAAIGRLCCPIVRRCSLCGWSGQRERAGREAGLWYSAGRAQRGRARSLLRCSPRGRASRPQDVKRGPGHWAGPRHQSPNLRTESAQPPMKTKTNQRST